MNNDEHPQPNKAQAIAQQTLSAWVGRTQQSTELLCTSHAAELAATLDRPSIDTTKGAALPPLWHWIFFHDPAPQAGLGEDGHPQRGDFLPPVQLPRRMWAGSEVDFHRPLRLGTEVTRTSTIADVTHKIGHSGELVFVTVNHQLTDAEGVAIDERQQIVYRSRPTPDAAQSVNQAAPDGASHIRKIQPSPPLLFRYSALTFNAHRIHYDFPYVTQEEGYPGLVVHGPLTATLLMDLIERQFPGATVKTFKFRAVHPLFNPRPFWVCAKPGDHDGQWHLWAKDEKNNLCMDASVELR